MKRQDDLSKVVEFISVLRPLFNDPDDSCAYRHIGALLADTSLQAGINYETVVRPRIIRILSDYADCYTTSTLSRLLSSIGVAAFLKWRHEEKIGRFNNLFGLIIASGIETIEDLHFRLEMPDFIQQLESIRGVGPKTIDYLKLLCGHPGVAIDRHLRRAVELAGVEVADYAHARRLLVEAGYALDIPILHLDRELWRTMRAF